MKFEGALKSQLTARMVAVTPRKNLFMSAQRMEPILIKERKEQGPPPTENAAHGGGVPHTLVGGAWWSVSPIFLTPSSLSWKPTCKACC